MLPCWAMPSMMSAASCSAAVPACTPALSSISTIWMRGVVLRDTMPRKVCALCTLDMAICTPAYLGFPKHKETRKARERVGTNQSHLQTATMGARPT